MGGQKEGVCRFAQGKYWVKKKNHHLGRLSAGTCRGKKRNVSIFRWLRRMKTVTLISQASNNNKPSRGKGETPFWWSAT